MDGTRLVAHLARLRQREYPARRTERETKTAAPARALGLPARVTTIAAGR